MKKTEYQCNYHKSLQSSFINYTGRRYSRTGALFQIFARWAHDTLHSVRMAHVFGSQRPGRPRQMSIKVTEPGASSYRIMGKGSAGGGRGFTQSHSNTMSKCQQMMHISDTLIQAVISAMKPFLPALFHCPATQTAKGLSSTQRTGERATIEASKDRGEEAHGVTDSFERGFTKVFFLFFLFLFALLFASSIIIYFSL